MLGQGGSNFGDAFHFIATTILLVKLTGSGLSAIFGIICSQVPSLILSPFAGYLGDRFNEKNLCMAIDLIRGFVVIMFVGNYNTLEVYVLILVLSVCDIVYSPARKKIIVNIINEKELLIGNSLLMGISGVAYLIGPFLASILIGMWGPDIAFFINSISFLFSALTVLFIRISVIRPSAQVKGRTAAQNVFADIKAGLSYYKRSVQIKEFVVLCSFIGAVAASMNIVFYPYAFDVLRVTDRGWGLMMSVFYGTNLFAMFISIFLNKIINKNMMPFIFGTLLLTSLIWFYYGITSDLYVVLVLQFVEGTFLAFSGILLGTKLQTIINKDYMARVMSIGDIIGNIYKLIGVGATCLILTVVTEKQVFFMNSVLLFGFMVYKLVTIRFLDKKASTTIC
jgi:MFS family permease